MPINEGDIKVSIAVLEQRANDMLDRIELRFQSHERAMEVQTKELARRLDFLNGEADRLRQMQATYVPREVYEDRHADITKSVRNLEMFQSNLLGKITVVVAVSALAGGIIGSVAVAVAIRWLVGP